MNSAPPAQEGQALIAVAVWLGVLVLLALAGLDWAFLKGTAARTQAAADAAALTGAQHTLVAVQTDARGRIYARTAAVDPVAGPRSALAAWQRAVASIPGLRVLTVSAVASGQDLAFSATVRLGTPGLAALNPALGATAWTLAAVARCGCGGA